MNQLTVLLLKLLRAAFAFFIIAGGIAVLAVGYFTLYPPAETNDVVMLNVKQIIPTTATDSASPLATAQEAVTAGKPSQLVMHSQNGTLVVREPRASRRLLLRIINAERGPLPLILAGLIFSIIMAKILADVKPGVPFSSANTRRLYWLALLFTGCEVYERMASLWMQHYLRGVAPVGVARLTPNSEFSSPLVANWLVAAMLLVLAASYRRGVELTEEAELTV